MITDRNWSIGETYVDQAGNTWKVTRLETLPIGTIPWVICIERAKGRG